MTNTFTGKVSPEGRLQIANLTCWRALLRHYASKSVVVSIAPPRKKSSDQQRKYYFGVIVAMLGDELGYTKDEMHEVLKWKFLRVSAEESGRPFDTIRSTEDMTTAERESYHDSIRIWAATDMGIVIPLPCEVPM